MLDIVRRMVWFFIVSAAVCYAIFFVLGQFADFEFRFQKPIAIRDDVSPGAHYLSGIVIVPSPCYQLSVEAQAVTSTTYKLVFGTWQEPAVPCTPEATARDFQTVVFAPLGVNFVAQIDGTDYPTAVLPRIVSTSKL